MGRFGPFGPFGPFDPFGPFGCVSDSRTFPIPGLGKVLESDARPWAFVLESDTRPNGPIGPNGSNGPK